MLRQDDYFKSYLVTAGWLHGREYGGHLAASMIMSTLMNRVRAGWGNVIEVVNNIPKFSAEEKMPIGVPQVYEPEFVHLLHDVEGIYAGSTKDATEGALFWCDTTKIETPFFVEKILGMSKEHPLTAGMNSLTFFR